MSSSPSLFTEILIRSARHDDAATLRRLAALESARAPRGQVLVAERDGHVKAALAVEDGHTVADPFSATADLITLLRTRARALGWLR
jgi:hypothetical protein